MEPNKLFDKSRLIPNILLVVLVVMNLFFVIQYIRNDQEQGRQFTEQAQKIEKNVKVASFLKFFIDSTLSTKGVISYDDRVKLEADIRELNDPEVLGAWTNLIASQDSESAQKSVVVFLSMLANRMI